MPQTSPHLERLESLSDSDRIRGRYLRVGDHVIEHELPRGLRGTVVEIGGDSPHDPKWQNRRIRVRLDNPEVLCDYERSLLGGGSVMRSSEWSWQVAQ